MRPMTAYEVNFALLKPVGLPAKIANFGEPQRSGYGSDVIHWTGVPPSTSVATGERGPMIERPCRVSKPEICGPFDLSV